MADKLLSARRLPGKIIRAPLRLIPRGSTVPILFGPGQGLKWLAGSGPHSCWLGFNELRKRRAFANAVHTGEVVYDIGANVGFYSLMAAHFVGPCGHVVALEPLPENTRWLQKHLEINHMNNVVVEEVAAWSTTGYLQFMGTPDRVTSHVSQHGTHTVRAVTIDGLVANNDCPPPDHLKIDVEGAESHVLQGATETLKDWQPTIFLATHGDECESECREVLDDLGYVMHAIDGYKDEFIAESRSRV